MGKRIKTARQSLAVAPQELHKRKRPETIAEDGEKHSGKARKKSPTGLSWSCSPICVLQGVSLMSTPPPKFSKCQTQM